MRSFHIVRGHAGSISTSLLRNRVNTPFTTSRYLSSATKCRNKYSQPQISTRSNYGGPFQNIRNSIFRRIRHIRHESSNARPRPDPTPHLGSPEPSLSLSQRMKKLSREYGWSAVGVYFALSALDFPFCFLAVRTLGTERIAQWEHAIIDAFMSVARIPFPDLGKKQPMTADGQQALPRPGESGTQPAEWSWGVDEAQAQAQKKGAPIWTQLALAYAIHKSFIFIRVPLTAAVTPRVVKTLRGWGWDIGKRKPKVPSVEKKL